MKNIQYILYMGVSWTNTVKPDGEETVESTLCKTKWYCSHDPQPDVVHVRWYICTCTIGSFKGSWKMMHTKPNTACDTPNPQLNNLRFQQSTSLLHEKVYSQKFVSILNYFSFNSAWISMKDTPKYILCSLTVCNKWSYIVVMYSNNTDSK